MKRIVRYVEVDYIKNRHQIKLKLKEQIKKANLSTDELREVFVSLFTKSFTVDDRELAMRFFELGKLFYQHTGVGCALCSNSAKVGGVPYLKGLVVMGWKPKWICERCKIQIRDELYDELS